MYLILSFLLATSVDAPAKTLAREVYKELIEINTTDSSGDNTRAAEPWRRGCAPRGSRPRM